MSQDGPGVIVMNQPQQVPSLRHTFWQPSDFHANEGPGVIFMREPQSKPMSVFNANPTVFLVAEPSKEPKKEEKSSKIKNEIKEKPQPEKKPQEKFDDDSFFGYHF